MRIHSCSYAVVRHDGFDEAITRRVGNASGGSIGACDLLGSHVASSGADVRCVTRESRLKRDFAHSPGRSGFAPARQIRCLHAIHDSPGILLNRSGHDVPDVRIQVAASEQRAGRAQRPFRREVHRSYRVPSVPGRIQRPGAVEARNGKRGREVVDGMLSRQDGSFRHPRRGSGLVRDTRYATNRCCADGQSPRHSFGLVAQPA